MTLSTDRKSASEGEYIEIRWACDACPDSLYLSIDSGASKYSIAVSDPGTTRIPVPRSNGKMTVKIIGVISGKKVTESIDIRVKGAKQARSKAPLSSRMKIFGEMMLRRLQDSSCWHGRWMRFLNPMVLHMSNYMNQSLW